MGQVITTQAVASASKGQRRSETTHAIASVVKFTTARGPVEERPEAFGDYKSCSIGGGIRACQGTRVE